MNDNIFKEQFNKNNVLSNKSNIQDIICLRNFSGLYEVLFDNKIDSYGELYVKCNGVVGGIRISYGNIALINEDSDFDMVIPLRFAKGFLLKIDGNAEKVYLRAYGVKFQEKNFEFYLPQNNLVVVNSGQKKLYSYSETADILNNNLTFLNALGDKDYLQSYYVNNVFEVGKITIDNAVYFCNSADNYANTVKIDDVADMAIFLVCNTDKVCFIYTIENSVYCKYLSNGILGNIVKLDTGVQGNPIELIGSISSSYNTRFFAIRFQNATSIYTVKADNSIQKVYETRSKNLKLFESESTLVVIEKFDYRLLKNKFQINEFGAYSDSLILISKESMDNVIDYIQIDDNEIITATSGLMTMVNSDESAS